MLHDDDRVALDCQFTQDVRKRGRIARMEADSRFVENVECPNQSCAELIGQGRALGFSPGERAGLTGESQIPKAYAEEKAKLGRELPENIASDLLFIGRKDEGCDPSGNICNGQLRQLMNVVARDLYIARIRSEAGSIAAWTGSRRSVAAEHHAHV
jgi:hypothetical protein